MKISIFGLGYVGCVMAACVAESGHEVWGVDINRDKVEMLNSGRSPILGKGLEKMIRKGRDQGFLRATTDSIDATLATEISFICVGTPGSKNGKPDLEAVEAVSQEIGKALSRKNSYHCVVLRSTVLPGTTQKTLVPLLDKSSGKKAHTDFDVCYNPEFLREGSSIYDFYNPPFTVIGQETPEGGNLLARLYENIDAPIEIVTYRVAEILKYACNSFHALKIAFANEIGVLCKSLDIDSHQVMNLFALDRKLNISEAYLKPGFAFGGPCLPKDLRALLYEAEENNIKVPVLKSVLESNTLHIRRAADCILAAEHNKVGILGLSFKAETDDLRESPVVTLVKILMSEGLEIRIYDHDTSLDRMLGANWTFIEENIPCISDLMCSSIEEVIRESNLVVVCKNSKEFSESLEPILGKKAILDLTHIFSNISRGTEGYEGICW